MPQVKAHIDGELEKLRADTTKNFSEKRKDALKYLPDKGAQPDQIVELIKKFAEPSHKFYKDGGNMSGTVYTNDSDHWDFLSEAMKLTAFVNPLHMLEFGFANTMEAEIIRWTINLYKGDENCCGILTQGGTESILLSMLAYREKFSKEKGITKPNIVMPESGHCAFDKAGFYYNIEIRKVPLTNDLMADV